MMKFADEAAIAKLTGKKTSPAQQRVLKTQRIPFKVDGNGKIVVLDAVLRRELGEDSSDTRRTIDIVMPDFAAISGAR